MGHSPIQTVDCPITGNEGQPKGAVFDRRRKYRYALWRRWKAGGSALFVIGLNPSTADEWTDDATIKRLIGFAKRDGFNALYMGNLFAFRARDPKALEKEKYPIGYYNSVHLLRMQKISQQTVLAWGAHAKAAAQADWILRLLEDAKVPLFCFGKTKTGQPKHPLYLKANTKIRIYSHEKNKK